MKKNYYVMMVSALLILWSACQKSKAVNVKEPDDRARVKLKEINVSQLPSPNYRFTYDGENYVSTIGVSAGFYQYSLEYENGRLLKMTNAVNGEFLVYKYTGAKVTAIDLYLVGGVQRTGHYDFAYDPQQRLARVRFFSFPGNDVDSVFDRMVELEYYADGNLALYRDYFSDGNGNLPLSSTTHFGDYDDQECVEDFGLIRHFFEPLLYLPSVKLQRNNPGSSRIITVNNDFEISYQYTYNNEKFPQSKTTTIKKTRGDNAGLVTVSTTQYSYY